MVYNVVPGNVYALSGCHCGPTSLIFYKKIDTKLA